MRPKFNIAPGFSIVDFNGDSLILMKKRGKVLVFNFWFIACGGCVKEIPELNKMVEHFKENSDIEFFAFTYDPKSHLVIFFRKTQFDFTIVPMARGIFYLYGVHQYPTTMIIDKSGKIAKIHKSIIDEDELEGLIQEIEKLLDE
ncbi:MAG: TlpA family protein disulfide reductase [Chlorobi bacterium]|nr:TlpA family protein disulfide reductase [Chlorobiota bacterium]